jgi:hypothetical protein
MPALSQAFCAMKPVLKIDWATHEAAKYAVENWHYSRRLPVFGITKIGTWEDGVFIGVVIFSRGATPEIGSPYGLQQTEICELTRVALKKHATPVSKIIAVAIRFLKKRNPKLKAIISFADAAQGHHGGIYQAGGWIYAGVSETHAYRVLGKIEHPKSLHSRYGKGGQSISWLKKNIDPNAERIIAGNKHRYLMPLDNEMREKILPLAKPYPKRAQSIENDAPGIPAGGGRCESDLCAPSSP